MLNMELNFDAVQRAVALAGVLLIVSCAAPADDGAATTSSMMAATPTDKADRVRIVNDGWTLYGEWRTPDKMGAYPAALLLHRAAGSRAEYDALGEALAERGVASLALDLRGHGESDNLGRFEPPYGENLHINENTHLDVAAALQWLSDRDSVDAMRLGVVGASYSGEKAAIAFRSGVRAAAYVMMSPGSFSQESIDAIGEADAAWLFVRTQDESPAAKQFIDAIHDELKVTAPQAETIVYPGAGHATLIFETQPQAVDDIADWLAAALGAAAGG